MGPARPRRKSAVALFDRLSTLYDTGLVQSQLYRPTQDQVLDQLRHLAPQRVLDVGCGTGLLTTRLGPELGAEQVYGCDAAAGMLDQARRRSSSVIWLHGPAEQVPLPDASVDAIVSTEAFHWFDQPAALREFHRLLVPGGHLVLAFVSPENRALATFLNRSPFLGNRGRWPAPSAMRKLSTEAGFRVTTQRRVQRIFGTLVPTVITVAQRLG